MLTIFTTPKPFTGHNKIIQENAIQSWKRLLPECEVILLGKDFGTAEAAIQFGCKYIPDVKCTEQGTPLINSLFYEAEKVASSSIMCFANCDIMFTNDLLKAITLIKDKKRALLVGQRYNVNIDYAWNFESLNWGSKLLDYAVVNGEINHPRGIDYFIFPKGQYKGIPDLTVGRGWWDNWMIYNSKRNFIPVIDGTKMILAVHQNHDYGHCQGGQKEAYYDGPEAQKNVSFLDNGNILMTIEDAEWIIDNDKIKLSFIRIYRHFNQLPSIFPVFKWPVKVFKLFLKPLKKVSWVSKLHKRWYG